jgi:hypothetical protein
LRRSVCVTVMRVETRRDSPTDRRLPASTPSVLRTATRGIGDVAGRIAGLPEEFALRRIRERRRPFERRKAGNTAGECSATIGGRWF